MEYYVIDIETTGINQKYHEITEISVIRCKDLVQKTWLIKIKYPSRCDPQALYITNKTKEELLNRKNNIEDVIPLVNAFIQEDGVTSEERVCIAHNAPFDSRFVMQVWKNYKQEFPIIFWECTLAMSRKFNKNNKLNKIAKLDDMLNKLNIKHEKTNNHSANVDCRNAFRLRHYLIKNGIEELQFIKANKEYVQNKNTTKAKEDEILEDDPAMEEIFNF